MRIGEMASVVGLSTSTIRYYEKIGLIAPPPRSQSGYRNYSEEDVRRLRLVAQARMLSLPLDEVRQLTAFAVDGRCGPLRGELLQALRKRAAETRRQIRELRSLQRELDRACVELANSVCPSQPASSESACACLDDLASSESGRFEDKMAHKPEGGTQMSDNPKEPTQPVASEQPQSQECGCGCMNKNTDGEKPEPTK